MEILQVPYEIVSAWQVKKFAVSAGVYLVGIVEVSWLA